MLTNSGPDDHVFINFVDHGAPGLVGFPTGLLTARSLNDTITKMFQRNMFKQVNSLFRNLSAKHYLMPHHYHYDCTNALALYTLTPIIMALHGYRWYSTWKPANPVQCSTTSCPIVLTVIITMATINNTRVTRTVTQSYQSVHTVCLHVWLQYVHILTHPDTYNTRSLGCVN